MVLLGCYYLWFRLLNELVEVFVEIVIVLGFEFGVVDVVGDVNDFVEVMD